MSARRGLTIALAASVAVAAIELWGGLRAHSLALTTDAVHVCTDIFALLLALAASIAATRPADPRRTFGYGRIEILGALVNGTLLLVATAAIAYEAIRRFAQPVEPQTTTMIVVAAVGLLLNAGSAIALRQRSERDVNVRAALFHVLGDALGAIAVIAGGIAIALTHRAWIDPALSLFVAALIVAGVFRLMREATDVLLESVPAGVDPAAIEKRLQCIAGVCGVHDLHVWSIGSASYALSAHVQLDDRRISEAASVLREIDECLKRDFRIGHVTVQFECDNCPVIVGH
jgi:cobalt-zinc-cadmium efflux system protein